MQREITKKLGLIVLAWMFVFSAVVAQDSQVLGTFDLAADAAVTDGSDLFLYGLMIQDETDTDDADEGGNILVKKGKIVIINLGPVVNHEGVDYAPTVSADGKTLYYVSNRPGSKLSADDDLTHDFWKTTKKHRLDTVFFAPMNIDTTTDLGDLGVNTPYNEGAASIAADKQSLYFTACNKSDGIGNCDLYKSTIQGDRWSRPVNLGRNVNSANWDSQPSISPDQSRIYFVSTREGPNSDGELIFENFDIWYADWDFEMEEWQKAKNLEQLNTKGSEASPFIAADGVTLFFASNGHTPNIGGLDFYVTRLDPDTDKWSAPENLGEPINTEMDEQFISLPASGDIIYFSSTREDLAGFQGNLDVFMAFVPTFFRTVLVKGTVTDECSDEFIPAKITVNNPVTGKVFNDSLTMTHQEFELIVSNQDFGNPKDSIKSIDLQVTAENEKYGKKSKVVRVEKPKKVEDKSQAGSVSEEIFVKITLGQKPVLGAEMDEADYIKRAKEYNTSLDGYRGLVMEQVQTWDLYPLLNYVFFDLGSSTLPDRYILFDSPDQTAYFTDTTIAGGTLDKYYHVLNIFAYRMTKNPDSKIEIVGTNDGTTPEEKVAGLSKERAELVYNYFRDIWKIDESRLKLTVRNKPKHPSNLKDSLGIRENRRVEILCKDWEIMKPVFDRDPKTFPQPEQMTYTMKNGIEDVIVDKRRIEIKRGEKMWKVLTDVGITDPTKIWDWTNDRGKYPIDEVPYTAQLIVTTKSGAECASEPITIPVMQVSTEKKKVEATADSTQERYNLILFPFDSPNAGPLNERIMRDYVYDRILPSSVVEVIGHTDVVGMYEHNLKLSNRRSNTVENGIKKKTKGKYALLTKRGVGEEEPLFDNMLPEGRFYNRTVQVIIKTPVEDWEEIEKKQEAGVEVD